MTNGKLTLEQLYRQGRKTLAQSPSIGEDAGFEALLLIPEGVSPFPGEELLLQGNHLPSPAQEQEYAALLEKRLPVNPSNICWVNGSFLVIHLPLVPVY